MLYNYAETLWREEEIMKKLFAMALAACMTLSLTACGGGKTATVAGIEDLPGKTIGVQLGTTGDASASESGSYTHLRAHEPREDTVCRLLLAKKNTKLVA